jgi:hypothetical protein
MLIVAASLTTPNNYGTNPDNAIFISRSKNGEISNN